MDSKEKFSHYNIILVEPKYSGNIGAVARAMMNFDFSNLSLVNPCDLTDECYTRAMHASHLIDNAQTFQSFSEAIKNIDYVAATSSIESISDKKHLRNALHLETFVEKIKDVKGSVGLVFGREDFGLYNQEIARCDALLRIPTSEHYLSLNLSHAVSIVLFSLYKRENAPKESRNIGKIEREKLYEFFSGLLGAIDYPSHKKENTEIMFKRIMGRAMLSTWEYHTLMGVLNKSVENLRKKQKH